MRHGAPLQLYGIDMPPGYNCEAHNAVTERLNMHANAYPDKISSFRGAWRAMAYRFKGATDASEDFCRSASIPGSPHPEIFIQDNSMFVCFTCGMSALECYFFAMHAMASILDPTVFRMDKEEDLRGITPSGVCIIYEQARPHEAVTTCMRECLSHTLYRQLKDYRDVLSHRGIPRRVQYAGGARNGEVRLPDNPRSLPSHWNDNLPVDLRTTSQVVSWLGTSIANLLQAADEFSHLRL